MVVAQDREEGTALTDRVADGIACLGPPERSRVHPLLPRWKSVVLLRQVIRASKLLSDDIDFTGIFLATAGGSAIQSEEIRRVGLRGGREGRDALRDEAQSVRIIHHRLVQNIQVQPHQIPRTQRHGGR